MSKKDFAKTLAKELKQAMIEAQSAPSAYDTQATVKRIENDVVWVHIPGGIDETPVKRTTNAKKDDVVQVRVSGGRAWLTGNSTSPPTDDTKAILAENTAISALDEADVAKSKAEEAALAATMAAMSAEKANEAAEEAVSDARIAHEAADEAKASAGEAQESANDAKQAASDAIQTSEEAAAAAEKANESADKALTSANNAQSNAEEAHKSADDAKQAASDALQTSKEAAAAAEKANESAGKALTAANNAQSSAEDAADSAEEAAEGARQAITYSRGALSALSDIEDVVDVVQWIADHGHYELTKDTQVDPDKSYYEKSKDVVSEYYRTAVPVSTYIRDMYEKQGDEYVPTKDNFDDAGNLPEGKKYYAYDITTNTYIEKTPTKTIGEYYELKLDESVRNYLATHLAVTDKGLWILQDETGYSVLVKADGVDIMNELGFVVASYGKEIQLQSDNGYSVRVKTDGLDILDKAKNIVASYGKDIRLGLSKDGLKNIITSTQIKFCGEDENNPYASIGQENDLWVLSIANARITDMLRFGQYAWIRRDNGNMSLKWID